MFKKFRDHRKLEKARKAERAEAIKQAKRDPTRFDHAPVFIWSSPLRRKQHKGWIWISVMSLVVSALLFYGSSTGNWIFVIAIIVAVIAYTADHLESTPQITNKISEFGIKVGKEGIPYSNIKAFWIIYNPPYVSTLQIRTFNKTMPDISIDLDTQDPAKIREYLTRHVVEWEGKEESFMNLSTRLLKL